MKMSSSFFIRKTQKPNNKRKQQAPGASKSKWKKGDPKTATAPPPPSNKRPKKDDEEIESDEEFDSDIGSGTGAPNLAFSSDEGEEETPQDKRLRLAKEYLEEIEKQEAERSEDKIHDSVSRRLQTEYLDSVGKLRRNIAASIVGYDDKKFTVLKHKKQKLPFCTLALSPDGKLIFSGAKTQFLIKWDLESLNCVGCIDVQPHNEDPDNGLKRRSHILAICISTDMKYLALADGGHNIQIWCPKELKHLKTFKGHRDVVTALTFRKDTHELYSGARDRSVKIWSLDEMAYVESLFGHQAGVTGIDALSRERAITSGGTDCSLRIWKITEESQLIYNGHRGSIESVKFINDENFVSAGDDGSLCLWSALKKKPLCVENFVHGMQTNGVANWISALTCLVNTDLVATGSCDGYIRLWQTVENARKLKKILEIPVIGFVNSLAFNADGSKLYAAVGQEHRLGRWWRIKEAKNKIIIFNLTKHTEKAVSN